MSIYENAIRYNGMRKEAVAIGALFNKAKPAYTAARNGISRILTWLGNTAQAANNERIIIQNAGPKEYSKYLGRAAKEAYSKANEAIQDPAYQRALGRLTASVGAGLGIGGALSYADSINYEAEGRDRGAEAESERASIAINNNKRKKLKEEIAKAKLVGATLKKQQELADNYLKYGLTGGGAVLGAGIGAGVAGEGNRLLGGVLGGGLGAGAGYGAYRIAKYLENA